MNLCDDAAIGRLIAMIEGDEGNDLNEVEGLLAKYPEDPRLHFMRGSILANRQRAIDAHAALTKAVELAPEFHIARYQLGFFELTSGEVDRALSSWGPLLRLPEDNYLRRFAEGLIHLVRDEFAQAIEKLDSGMACNHENEPLNRDIALLLAQCRKLQEAEQGDSNGDIAGPNDQSATSIVLGRFSPGSTRH